MRLIKVFVCALCLIAFALPSQAANKAKKAPVRKIEFSDEAIENAIARGIEFLWSKHIKDMGAWKPIGNVKGEMGLTALAAYALLESGVRPEDPRMKKTLAWLAKHDEARTYSIACRASAYYAADRLAKGKYKKALKRDVRVLLRGVTNGKYSYVLGEKRGSISNDHFGALGVWVGVQADLEIPRGYWGVLAKHWKNAQSNDGGWGYSQAVDRKSNKSTAAMTAAGVVTLYVCNDQLNSARSANKLGGRMDPSIKRGLNWLEKHLPSTLKTMRGEKCFSYTFYSLERAALASGYKYFGNVDWYKDGATRILNLQDASGAFKTPGNYRDPIVNTSFCLLFLLRGRNPIAFNRLEYEGDWNNRPRALAFLTRWMSGKFENKYAWQIVNLKSPPESWRDAQILCISGALAPRFTDQDIDRLRRFISQGGMLYTVSEGKGKEFSDGIRQTCKKLFPKYEMTKLPKDHPLFKIHFKLRRSPELFMITNSVHPLVIHSDSDMTKAFQLNQKSTSRQAFELATNIFIYVTDIASPRRRGTSTWPEKQKFTPKSKVRITRLKHAGNYDPEPLAHERFARLMGAKHQIKIDILPETDIAQLGSSQADLAALTGTGPVKLSAAEKASLKAFVAEGGTVFIDAAGGEHAGKDRGFIKSIEKHLAEMYGAGELATLASSGSLYQLSGMKINRVSWRKATRAQMGRNSTPRLRAIFIGDRPAIIVSRLDVTAALVGCPAYGVWGYHQGSTREAGSAFEIMRNITVFAGKGK